MKELSIKEKAKAYDEAIKKLRSLHDNYDTVSMLIDVKEELENIFPELTESGGEKIRKALLEMVQDTIGDSLWVDYNVHRKDAIAWLEKQGEQKPDIIIPKFRVGDTIRIKNSDAEYTITEISDGYYRGKGWCLDIAAGDECGDYELVEQKPWSEEDEKFFKTALWHISYSISNGKSTDFHCDTTDWFKSIKDRVQPQSQWKPSDKQMELLREVQQALLGKDCHNRFVDFMYELKRLRE